MSRPAQRPPEPPGSRYAHPVAPGDVWVSRGTGRHPLGALALVLGTNGRSVRFRVLRGKGRRGRDLARAVPLDVWLTCWAPRGG